MSRGYKIDKNGNFGIGTSGAYGVTTTGEVGIDRDAGTLGDLADVDLTGAASNNALIYNGTKWVPGAAGGGGGGATTFSGLTDVDTSNKTTANTALQWDSGLGKYVFKVITGVTNWIDVTKYGAVGDGTTDDTAAIQAAINSGNPVLFTKGTYKVNGEITVHRSTSIVIHAEEGAIIDATASTAPNTLRVGGTMGAGVVLSANAVKGTRSVQTAATLAKGDIILISTRDNGEQWNTERYYYYKGELAVVDSVSGGTVNLVNPLYDSYTAANTKVFKLNAPVVDIRGLEIKRNSTHNGLYIEYAKDVIIADCKITGAREACFRMFHCLGGRFANNYADDFFEGEADLDYGLSMITCQDIEIVSNRMSGGRHALTIGGEEPSRSLRVAGNVFDSSPATGEACLDTHGAAEFITIDNNTCRNGIGITSKNTVISNNTVHGANAYNAIQVWHTFQGTTEFLIIRGNTVVADTPMRADQGITGIYVQMLTDNQVIDELVIEDNVITSSQYGIHIRPTDSTITGAKINRLTLRNNTVKNVYLPGIADSGKQAIYMPYANTTIAFDVIDIEGGFYQAGKNPTVPSVEAHHAVTIDGALCQNLYARNTTFECQTADNQVVDTIQRVVNAEFSNVLVKGAWNGTDRSWKNEIDNSGKLKITGCKFSNVYSATEIAATVTDFIANDNTFENTSGTGNTFAVQGASTRRITTVMGSGNVIGYATAMPTAGTWTKGDYVENINPTVIGTAPDRYIVEGWKRITAGSSNVLNTDWVELRTRIE